MMGAVIVALGVCLIGMTVCDTIFTKHYIKQELASGTTGELYVKTRSKLECATLCSRDQSGLSFTFNKANKSCYCAKSREEMYLESGVPMTIKEVCHSNTGYQFESSVGVCYRFEIANLATAKNAKAICENERGHLVRIYNTTVNDFFFNLIVTTENIGTARVFIDGSDEETEGVWKLSNGEMMTWGDWAPGEPYDSTAWNCAEFFKTFSWKWAAGPCIDTESGYLCEIDV